VSNSIYVPGRGIVLADVETAYGQGAAAMTSADVVYAEDVSIDLTTDPITRTGTSPERVGFRAVAGMNHATLSMSTECRPKVQTGVTDADAPDIDRLLRAAGWARVDDPTSPPFSQTYICTSHNAESVQVQVLDVNADQANANASSLLWSVLGVRFDWSFSWNAGERWMWTFTGAGLTANPAYTTISDTGDTWISGYAPLPYGIEEPLTAKGAVGNGLVELDTPTIYGGGTLGSPNNEVLVLSLSASGNMGLSEQSGVSASGGIGRVSLAPTDPATIECVVEQTNLSGWDPYQYLDEQQPIECNFTLTQTGTGAAVVTAQIDCYGVITAITRADDAGRRTWGLTIQLCYPEDAVTGAPPVGSDPGQEFTSDAVNGKGLNVVPAAGLGKLGIMAIQFNTN